MMKYDDLIIYVMLITLVIGLTILSRKNVVINIITTTEKAKDIKFDDEFATEPIVEVNHQFIDEEIVKNGILDLTTTGGEGVSVNL